MTAAGRRDSAAADVGLAREELRAAQQLLDTGFPRIALSRIYFAVFHAARARLFAAGLEPRTHAGTQHLWNLHLVREGHYEAATSQLLARLQKYREEADYAIAFVVDEGTARDELAVAGELVERIAADIERAGAEDASAR